MNDKLELFYRGLKDQKVSFIGLGRSHRELLPMFASKGARVSLRDKRTREQIGEEAGQLEALGIRLILGEGYLDNLCEEDMILRTPGMYYYHPALQEAQRSGVAVVSEMELFFDLCPCKIYAVTGSDGKTTTTSVIAEFLKAQGFNVFLGGNIGFPLLPRIEQIGPEDRAVVELSSFQMISMRKSPDVAVITNISPNHLDVHKDMQEYMESKAKLFSLCKVGVVNADDPSLEGILQGHTCQVKTYGFETPADLRGADCRHLNKPGFLGIAFEVSGEEDFTAEVDIPGRFNAYNALAAIGACHELGVPVEAMKQGLSTVKVKGRVEPVPVPGNYTLLLDYAHNGVGMENILTTLREYHPKRLICMFGAGGNRPKVRRYEMGEISGRLADISVLTADNSRFEDVNDIIADIKVGMAKTEGKYVEIPDRREAIRWCLENAQEGDIIVLAGKGHEDYQEIQGEKRPFDERVVIRELLEEMGTPQPQAAP